MVGANPLGTNAGFNDTVRLYGYPASSDTPLICSNSTAQYSAYQRIINCPSYSGGTSGGPWISTSTGAVTGIIGGYQQGGNTDDTYLHRLLRRHDRRPLPDRGLLLISAGRAPS